MPQGGRGRLRQSRLKPTGACGPWRDGWTEPCGRQRWRGESGSHGGACAQVYLADTCVSRRELPGIDQKRPLRHSWGAFDHRRRRCITGVPSPSQRKTGGFPPLRGRLGGLGRTLASLREGGQKDDLCANAAVFVTLSALLGLALL